MIERNRARMPHVLIGTALSLAAAGSACGQERHGYTGASLYKTYCASCHGVYGRGNGPVAPSLKVEVPDLTRIAARHGGQFPAEQIRRIIDGRATRPPHGPRDMPVWGDVFRITGSNDVEAQKYTTELVDLLTEYLRSIQTPVSVD